MKVIEVRGLVKKFKSVTAVDGITFDVEEGELFGLLGPNGAGKTTTMRILATLLPATSGSASVAGFDVSRQRNEVRASIGMVFQEPALDRQLTGRENLDFHGRMYGMRKDLRSTRIREVLELVELSGRADDLVQTFSGGMQRRLEIARGLMHSPRVLFLDEPTLGLDAQTRRKIWEYIRSMNKTQRTTIVLSTHYMEEADNLCDRVGIIDRGRIVALDTPRRLKDTIGADVVTLETDCGECGLFGELDFVKEAALLGDRIRLMVENGERKIPLLMESAHSHGIRVLSVELHKPSLEDVFLRFTGATLRDREGDPANASGHPNPRMRRG
ncbi:MAG: ATP-binding cassette domain-containing protein [Methanoregulaceae archaeon]|nr:ATP-binding cassette domain-containing protein [Methanoregulaceae archaeon]